MARILILEPSPEISELLVRLVARLGHEPLLEAPAGGEVAVVVVEPASRACVDAALAIRDEHPHLPVVCVSVCEPSRDMAVAEPHAYLVKPFPLAEFERAVLSALQVGDMDAVTPR